MKILIIEDENAIAKRLKSQLLSLRPDAEISGITTDIQSSVEALSNHPDIDIVFADIKIDDGLSFSVFDKVDTNAMVVFTTAYDEYALKAFDYNCIDYLLKPVGTDDLGKVLAKYEAMHPHISTELVREIANAVRERREGSRKRLVLERGRESFVCEVGNIAYIAIKDNDVRVYLSDGKWGSCSKTISDLDESLPEEQFFRVNRQAIVNISFVRSITPGHGRDSLVWLRPPFEGESFDITHSRKLSLLEILDK